MEGGEGSLAICHRAEWFLGPPLVGLFWVGASVRVKVVVWSGNWLSSRTCPLWVAGKGNQEGSSGLSLWKRRKWPLVRSLAPHSLTCELLIAASRAPDLMPPAL